MKLNRMIRYISMSTSFFILSTSYVMKYYVLYRWMLLKMRHIYGMPTNMKMIPILSAGLSSRKAWIITTKVTQKSATIV